MRSSTILRWVRAIAPCSVALFTIGTFVACSSTPDGPPSNTSASTKAADTTTCDPALLAWNLAAPGSTAPKTCSGGARYTTYNPSCSHNYPPAGVGDAHCPEADIPKSHPVTNSCWWATSYGTSHVHARLPTRVERDCCDPSVSGWCPKPPCHNVTVATESCAQMMANDVSYYQTRAYNGELWQNPYNYGQSIGGANLASGANFYCDYDLTNVPTDWQYTPNAWNCGTSTVNDAPVKTWPSCSSCNASTSDGCTSCNYCTIVADDNSCGDVAGAQYSAFGSALPAVHDLDKANCLTDENNPINPSSPVGDAASKYQHLTDNYTLAHNNGTTLDNAALQKKIVVELKLLFEMFGDSLTPDQQNTIIGYYSSDPDSVGTPSCGVGFTPPDTSQCPTANAPAVTKVNDELDLCARLTAPYVNSAVRDLESVKKTCIDSLSADIAALRPAFVGNGGIDDGSTTADPADVCAFKTYRAAFDQFVSKPFEARLEGQVDPMKSADQPEIVARLKLMDRWYNAIAQNLYPYIATEAKAPQVQAAAWQHATDAEGIFWQGIYRRIFPSGAVTAGDGGVLTTGDGGVPNTGDAGPNGATFTSAQLAALVKDALNADRAVLKLLFPFDASTSTPGTAPMTGAMLLPLMGDAFQAFSQRMHDIGIYHDMGCAYLGCGPAVQSELVWLMQMLADLPDPTSFSASIAGAKLAKDPNGNPIVRATPGDWLDIYASINVQHAVIEGAVQQLVGGGAGWTYAANGQSLLSDGNLGTAPGPIRHLAGEVQKARGAEQQYRTTGLFSPSARNRLPAGMGQDTVDGIRQDVSKRASDLSSSVSTFSSDLTSLATSVVSELAPKAQMTHTLDEIRKMALEFDNTMDDIDGLRDSLEANRVSLGVLAKSFTSLTAFDDGTLINGKVQGPWKIDDSAAKAPGNLAPNSDISAFAAQSVLGLGKGTVVTVQVDPASKWTPTCALQQANTLSGGIKSALAPGDHPVDLSDSQTGPEGYVVTLSNGNSQLHSNQTGTNSSRSTNSNVEGNMCAGAHAQIGVGVGVTEVYGYVDVSVCGSLGQSTTDATTTSSSDGSSSESRATMNFASGLRLDNAPFPKAPVGSLLAVVTVKGQPTQWKDVRVVQAPSTAIILSDDSDVYLVANDIAAGGCGHNPQFALNVSVGTLQTAGTATQWVTNALGGVAGYFDGLSNGVKDSSGKITTPSILTQGRLTPDQVSTFRSTAWTTLVAACNADKTVSDKTLCDTSKLPETVKEFITAYVDRSIEAIDLEIAILQTARQMNGLGLQFQQLVDDYNSAQRQAEIAELVPQWTLRRLDTQLLQAQTAQLVNAATYQLYPVLQLRYPDVFAAGLENDGVLRSNMQTLVNAPWDAPVDDLARAAAAAATELSNATQSIAVTYPPVTPKAIALAFSRTGKVTHQWMSVGNGRGQPVFDQAAQGNHVATFEIHPEDLYNIAGGLPSLRCTEQVPVVRDFAVVLAGGSLQTGDETSFANRPITVNSWSARRMQFPRAALFDPTTNTQLWPGGMLDFDLGNADWANLDTQILAAVDPSTALKLYDQRPVPSGADPKTYFVNGRGLSPINQFSIDFSALYNTTNFPSKPVEAADHMILILNVEFRQQSQPMTFIRTCN